MRALQAARNLPIVRLAGGPLRRVGRKVTPLWLKRRIAPMIFRIEQKVVAPMHAMHPLHACPAVLAEAAFANGPIIVVNNALAWGGAERQVVNTLRGLKRRQARPVGLLCLRLGLGEEYDFYLPEVARDVDFVRNVLPRSAAQKVLSGLTPEQHGDLERATAWMPSDIQDEVHAFLAEFLTLKPAVVHIFQDSTSVTAGYAAQIAGVPRIILSGRNMRPTNFVFYRPLWADAYRQLANCPRVAFVNNSAAGATDYDQWLGFAPGRVTVHRNGIDPEAIRRAEPADAHDLRTRLGIPDDAPLVGSIFRFYEEKRPLLWIETAARVAQARPDVHFAIFGLGPMKEECEALARKSGFADRLHTPGTTSNAGLALSPFDVFLLTSRFEGTPNAIIEASLVGVPVVTTRAGGTAEAVETGTTGLVADGHDAECLAGLVIDMLADPQWPERARVRGPMFIRERFGMERMIDETLAFYDMTEGN